MNRLIRPPFLLLLLFWVTMSKLARAQEPPPVRQASLVFDDRQQLRMSIGYRDIVDAATSTKLQGGLPTTIVMRAYLFPANGSVAVAATYKACRVTFDLWEEVYRVEISQTGNADVATYSPTLEGVLRRCAEVERLAIIARPLLASGAYYLAAIVEVNPVSPDMIERIKRWVSRPTGASTAAPGDALFGSFVGLFVARIGNADRQVTFRTQSFSL